MPQRPPPGQNDQGHEQNAGGQAAAHAVQQPAQIGRELLRLWAGQQHAEIQRVQEARVFDPFFLVDQYAMHQGDLRRGAPEIDAADGQPDFEGFSETRFHLGVHHATFMGQLCRSSTAKRSPSLSR